MPRGKRRSVPPSSYLLFFGPHLLSGDVPHYGDHLVTNIPLRQYVAERQLSGELPQWYPYESLGVPVIGQIALGTFHSRPRRLGGPPVSACSAVLTRSSKPCLC